VIVLKSFQEASGASGRLVAVSAPAKWAGKWGSAPPKSIRLIARWSDWAGAAARAGGADFPDRAFTIDGKMKTITGPEKGGKNAT
jgi:hypothetical protein